MRNLLKLIGASALALSATAEGSETVGYRYDVHGRLIRMDRSGDMNNGIRTTYTWDRADNRTSRATRVPATSMTVANFSYEEPEVGTGYVYNPSVTGMTFSSYSGVSSDGQIFRAPRGDQVGFVQSTSGGAGSITHSVTSLIGGQSYRITFWIAHRPGKASNTVHVSANGVSLGSYTATSTEFTSVTTPAFQASGSSATIRFAGSPSWGDAWAELDAVSLTP